MSARRTEYEVPPEALSAVLAELARRFPTPGLRATEVREELLDTADARLARRGLGLSFVEEGRTAELLLVDESTPLLSAPVQRVPEFAHELAPGPLASRVGAVTGNRRLLRFARLRRVRRRFEVRDAEHKTLVRLSLEERWIVDADGGAGDALALPPALFVEGLRGYEEAEGRARALVREELSLGEPELGERRRCRALAGSAGQLLAEPRTPVLSPDTPALEAARALLAVQADRVLATEQGTREDLDVEFLHDFRVAVRRSRTLLSLLEDLFPRPVVEHYGRELAWLASCTGPTRDLDVLLEALPALAAACCTGREGDLERFTEEVRAHRRRAQAELSLVLAGDRYRRLADTWREYLSRTDLPPSRLETASLPVGLVARERIETCHRRLLRRGRAVRDDSPIERVHRVRIEGKRLRYLLELFGPLFGPEPVERFVRSLRRLQVNLGELNDLAVQARTCAELFVGFARACDPTAAEVAAVSRLLVHLERRRDRRRQGFPDAFRSFARRSRDEDLRRLLASGGAA